MSSPHAPHTRRSISRRSTGNSPRTAISGDTRSTRGFMRSDRRKDCARPTYCFGIKPKACSPIEAMAPISVRSQRLGGFLPALRRRRAGDDVVHVGEFYAVAHQALVEIGLRHRWHVGDDGPGLAAVEALEHLPVGVGGVQRVAVGVDLDGEGGEQRTLTVRQAAEQPLPGFSCVATAKYFSARAAELVPVHR